MEGSSLKSGRDSPVLFYAEAGPAIGLGHLKRCLSLAQALKGKGIDSVFLAPRDSPVKGRVGQDGFSVFEVHGFGLGEGSIVEISRREGISRLVVDSYRLSAKDLQSLRREIGFVAAIDDLAPFEFPCQLVISPGAHAPRMRYRSLNGDTRFLLGPRYAMLRPEFRNRPARRVRPKVEEVLVVLGGDDRWNLMPRLIKAISSRQGTLAGRDPGLRTTAVIGPFFQNREELFRLAEASDGSVQLVEQPEGLFDLIRQSDLAISAAGQALYELACLGTPTVAIEVAENQHPQDAALDEMGVISLAGRAEDPDLLPKVVHEIQRLAQDRSRRERMAQAGQRLVDGAGAIRVAEEGFLR